MYRWKKRTRVAPKARNKEEKCISPRCRNRKAVHVTYHKSAKTGERVKYINSLSHCWKCRARMLKKSQPATYVLNAVRQRAKARKLPFTITLAEFKKWCEETGYLEKRGRDPHSYTIDRIDHDKGYHIWNIQIKTFLENCTNGHTVPGRETMQNERKPESYDYDYSGPSNPIPGSDAGYVTPVDSSETTQESDNTEPEVAAPVEEGDPF